MQTNNIPKGTFQITLTNALQYLTMGLFYIAVTKTNALTKYINLIEKTITR